MSKWLEREREREVERKTGGKKRERERGGDKKRGKEKARRGREGNNEPIQRPNPRSYTFFLSSPSPRFGPRTFSPLLFFFLLFFPNKHRAVSTPARLEAASWREAKIARAFTHRYYTVLLPTIDTNYYNERRDTVEITVASNEESESFFSSRYIFFFSCFAQHTIFVTRFSFIT